MQAYRWLIRCGAVLMLLAGAALAADNVVLVSSQASQGSNDSASWVSPGKDGSLLGASFGITSTNKMAITASLQGANSVTSVVCPASSSCSWTTSGNGISAGDALLWTSDAGAGGNGPLTLNFASSVGGVGASVQADAPGPFTASLQVFNGSTSLGSFSVKSDASGNPVYIGALDKTAAKITSAVFSLTDCAAVCSDFAIDTVYLNEPVADYSLSGTSAGAIDPGQTATYTVTVTPAAGFHQPVTLACSGAPALTTCTINPGSVTPDGSNPVKATVTVTTTPRTNGALTSGPGVMWAMYLAMPFGAMVLMSGTGRKGKRALGWIVIGLVMFLVGCGGGSSSSSSGGGGSPGTAAGTYSLTVTGVSGSISHSVSLGLTVN